MIRFHVAYKRLKHSVSKQNNLCVNLVIMRKFATIISLFLASLFLASFVINSDGMVITTKTWGIISSEISETILVSGPGNRDKCFNHTFTYPKVNII